MKNVTAPSLTDALDLRELVDCSRCEKKSPRVDRVGQTSVAGVWAAGNVANPRAQVITAAGEGSA
ncbi:MAG TPA: hypothetical protein VHC01_06180, partial [Gaiellaceae bacterium]|nr:hypothetical protein [Gaiellaceae bacterium]